MNEFIKFLRSRCIQSESQLQEYYAENCIGHSKLVDFENNGPSALRKEYNVKVTEEMEFGNIIDTLLTKEHLFSQIYFIPNNQRKLTPSEQRFVDYVVENNIYVKSLYDEELLELANICHTYSLITKDTTKRLDKLRELFPIIQDIQANSSRKRITAQQLDEALNCIHVLKSSDITKHLFEDSKRVLYQVKGYSRDDQCHCLFDMIYVDYKNHIIHPIDLKYVSYPERDFLKNSFYKFKYYRQAEMYMDMLHCMMSSRDRKLWRVAPFKFMVINKTTLSPMLYEFPIHYNNNNELQIGENSYVPNYHDIVKKILWHEHNKQYMYDRDTYMQLLKNEKSDFQQFVTTKIIPLEEADIIKPLTDEERAAMEKSNEELTSGIFKKISDNNVTFSTFDSVNRTFVLDNRDGTYSVIDRNGNILRTFSDEGFALGDLNDVNVNVADRVDNASVFEVTTNSTASNTITADSTTSNTATLNMDLLNGLFDDTQSTERQTANTSGEEIPF